MRNHHHSASKSGDISCPRDYSWIKYCAWLRFWCFPKFCPKFFNAFCCCMKSPHPSASLGRTVSLQIREFVDITVACVVSSMTSINHHHPSLSEQPIFLRIHESDITNKCMTSIEAATNCHGSVRPNRPVFQWIRLWNMSRFVEWDVVVMDTIVAV